MDLHLYIVACQRGVTSPFYPWLTATNKVKLERNKWSTCDRCTCMFQDWRIWRPKSGLIISMILIDRQVNIVLTGKHFLIMIFEDLLWICNVIIVRASISRTWSLLFTVTSVLSRDPPSRHFGRVYRHLGAFGRDGQSLKYPLLDGWSLKNSPM